MTEFARAAEEIFLAALEQAGPVERLAHAEHACQGKPELLRRVQELLACHDGSPGPLDNLPVGPGDTLNATEAGPLPAAAIGPYRLLQPLGEGGMGTVYLAQQTDPVKRLVALKLIRPGMDSKQVIARFEAERQALALMDHPNIARVLDAGSTEQGRPYFVMELVQGMPLTRYCDEQGLTPRQRLELFVPVCRAVQHAHQKGVIHRDLKPGNVLVGVYDGRPVPKVIDFGVAKAASQLLTERTLVTSFGAVIGTLEYMAPEQAEPNTFDVDTRGDIYSLGVLLYELLTGTTPLERGRLAQAALFEALRLIREEEPPRPSTRLSATAGLPAIAAQRGLEPGKLHGVVRGELDWIVMKCLEKDRALRYETANGLALDLQRYLADEPVQACPPSVGYRLRKFARRNRLVLSTVGLVSVALVLATLVSSWQAVRATRAEGLAQERLQEKEAARQEAVANLRKAREAADQLLTRVANQLSDAPHMAPVRKALLEDALTFYRGLLQKSNDPALRLEAGRAWFRIGEIYHYFDQHRESANAFAESVQLLEELVRDYPAEPKYREVLSESCNWLAGEQMRGLGQPRKAEPIVRRAADLIEGLAAEHPEKPGYRAQLARIKEAVADVAGSLGRKVEEEKGRRAALALAENLVRQFPADAYYEGLLANALSGLARTLESKSPREAETLFRREFAVRQKKLGWQT